MPTERATATSIVQIGVETTPGVAVPATKRLGSLNLALSPDADVAFQGPQGYMFDTTSSVNREWSTSDISGLPNYAELQYPFSSLLGTGVVTTPATAVLSRDWVFEIKHNRQGTPKTFTIEQGDIDAGTAEQAAYAMFTSLNMTFSKTGGIDLGGTVMAQLGNYDFTLTDPDTVTGLPQVPVQNKEVNLYLDLTGAGIGGTQWVDAFSCGWSVDGRWGYGYPLNRSKQSYDRHYATKPDPTITLSVANNATGRDLIDYFRSRKTVFLRIDALGPLIETIGTGPGTPFYYMMQLDCAVQFSAAFTPGDIDGLATLDWEGRIVYDATWDAALKAKLRNTQATL